jgi:hypothetical protein
MPCVLQPWVCELPIMQQTVLLLACRGPDGQPKYTAAKYLLRWYRRCVLLTAFERKAIDNPYDPGGGSFTGPSIQQPLGLWERERVTYDWEPGMKSVTDDYFRDLDAMPMHFHNHMIHGVEILGYKHPDARIAGWWRLLYETFCRNLHMAPESAADMDFRLGDSPDNWKAVNHPATHA